METDRFWEMNDVLFAIDQQTGAVNVKDLSRQAGVAFDDIRQALQEKSLWQRLKQDIQAGIDHNLTGTPGFVIDGKVYMGQVPADVFREYGLSGAGKRK
jgi:protein-disulfide isomerase